MILLLDLQHFHLHIKPECDKDEPLILGDKEEIKQYFKEKAEKGE